MAHDQPWLGGLLIVISAVAFSLAGFFARLIPLDAWTLLFWRGIYGGLFIAGAIVWLHGRDTLAAIRATGRAGLLAAACSTLATICFINALQRTSVADVMVINATTPFFAAALAWLCTGERESGRAASRWSQVPPRSPASFSPSTARCRPGAWSATCLRS